MDTISDLFKYFLTYIHMSYFQYYLLKTTNYKKKNTCVWKNTNDTIQDTEEAYLCCEILLFF
jgi:hypothetical protein